MEHTITHITNKLHHYYSPNYNLYLWYLKIKETRDLKKRNKRKWKSWHFITFITKTELLFSTAMCFLVYFLQRTVFQKSTRQMCPLMSNWLMVRCNTFNKIFCLLSSDSKSRPLLPLWKINRTKPNTILAHRPHESSVIILQRTQH